ncbi:MAG TPA: Rpn family recombination-promoting nuclease/putative transposase [Thermoanaerobaculia bacterium]|nr:Rpn family recombination-promoting nuclease/putative transposase [Thermoanaerobaculia bacterium]
MTESLDETRVADLFTHPRMIHDLLRGYLREAWVDRLDVDSLERWPEQPRCGAALPDRWPQYGGDLPEAPGSLDLPAPWPADDPDVEILRHRPGDLVWRARLRGGRSWIYLVLALPGAVDPWMALRLLDRICRLDVDLEERGLLRGRRLPPRVALVLYRGRDLWTAARDVADLVEAALPSLERWQPRLRYHLLDVQREPVPGFAEQVGRDNLVSRFFSLERSRSLDEIAGHAHRLHELLAGPENAGLRQAFARYLGESLLPRLFPGAELPAIHDLAEAGPRLREAVVEWTERWQQHRRSLAALLVRLIERKFGPLDEARRAEVEMADAACLLAWGERSATAATLAEVFAQS